VLLEGRDAAVRTGNIKRVVEHLSPRRERASWHSTNPPDRERSGWYFQRFVVHLPVAGELVLFNRSWYNRAGVEHVMGFCSGRSMRSSCNRCRSSRRVLVNSGIRSC
jgi:polyphosphate kinase 2 (PPK2 family)